jgi:soluble lytic murein transglycosylase-like protein
MSTDGFIALARAAAEKHRLDPALVCALCHQESSWKPWAVRYEPEFFERYISHMKGVSPTEMQLRATSFGVMQILGQTAREFGFDGDFLTELLDPVIGLEYGCRKLQRAMDRANDGVIEGLLLYNGGGDKQYPDRVLRYWPRYNTFIKETS